MIGSPVHTKIQEDIGQKDKKMAILDQNDQILAQNGQILAISEFSQHKEYNFLKDHHKTCFHMKNYDKLQPRLEDIGQKDQKMGILAKDGQILAQNGQILAISEFSRQIEYNFLKEHHKTCFQIKNYENLQRRLEDIGQKDQKMRILAKKWPNFGPKRPNFGHIRIFPAYRI